ncbi:MAG: PASTA domain-containing protein [Calditrichia bacterium]
MEKVSRRFFKKIFNKKNFIRLLLFVIIFIGFVLLLDWVLMPLYTKHGEEHDLPDVTEIPIEQAVEVLQSQDFIPIIQDSVYDEHFAPGLVIRQNPLPFSRVKKGRRVYLVISIGEKPRFAPKLIGLTAQDAEFRLREEGISLGEKFYNFSSLFHKGVVMAQSIPAGKEIKQNQGIDITISLGPAPTTLEIPNLVGKSLVAAERELDTLGVKIGIIKYSYKPQLVPGTILRQSISPGQKVAFADSINLLVSTDIPPVTEEKHDSTK